MLRALGVVAFLLATAPASAQVAESPISAEDAIASVGKTIVTSDGVALGKVQGVFAESGGIVLLTEMERPLGIGAQIVTIESEFVTRVGERVELSVTAGEIRERLRDSDSLTDAANERGLPGRTNTTKD